MPPSGMAAPVAEVEDHRKSFGRVRESVLVNDEARIDAPVEHRPFDFGKYQLGLVGGARKCQRQQEVGRGVLAGDGNAQCPGADLLSADLTL
jgi:hypothetical protein